MTTRSASVATNQTAAVIVQRSFVALVIAVAACATLPPGSDYPKTPSTAFEQPSTTRLGKQLAKESGRHPGQSGFRIVPHGVDGLLLRTQLVRAAERSIDIQYYIFAEDDTGKLLQKSILDAADRGVRIRLLIDDQNSFQRHETPEIIAALNDHANIELRLFNPFVYRGQFPVFRYIDMAVNEQRVNHRMHNKLMVADGAIAIVGGRNVADEYFDAGTPLIRFGDFDVAAVGPVVPQLSASFDEFWNSSFSIPQKALAPVAPLATSLPEARAELATHRAGSDTANIEQRLNKGDPLNGLLDGRLSFVWANAAVVADRPGKAEVPPGEPVRSPIVRQLMQEMRNVKSEVAIVTPYFVPGDRAMTVIKDLRQRNVRVRILTNSLSSTDAPIVHSAYKRYRTPLLEAGVELSELRAASDGAASGSGSHGSSGSSGSGSSDAPFALHAKLYIFDRQRVFIGSANFDRRSFKVNTELGLIIESRELAGQIVAQFEQFAASPNSYRLILEPGGPTGDRIRWRTQFDGKPVDLDDDPDTTPWRRFETTMYSMLPIDELL